MELLNHLWLLLAYSGMLLHVLTKIEEERKKGTLTTLKKWFIDNIISLIISVIGIPIILISMNTPAIAEMLPINNLTSIFIGWQTQSILKSLMTIAGKNLPKDETTPT